MHNFNLETTAIDAREAGGGLSQALLFDDFLVVPDAASNVQGASGAPMQRLVKYNLATPSPKREDLIPAAAQQACPGGCEWRWISDADAANKLLVFAALKPGTDITRRATSSDLNAFEALWIIDVARGQGTALDAAKISKAVAACAVGIPAGTQDAQRAPTSESLLPKRSSSRMFVAGTIDSLYLGVVTGQSIDLMVIANGAATCVGTLYVYGEMGQWMVAQDGKSLLAVGDSTGASWGIAETVSVKADKDAWRRKAPRAGLRRGTQGRHGEPEPGRVDLGDAPSDAADGPVRNPPPKAQPKPKPPYPRLAEKLPTLCRENAGSR